VAAPAATAIFRPDSAGVIPLISQAVALRSTQSQMTSLVKETDALLAAVLRLRAAATGQARELMQSGIAVVQGKGAGQAQPVKGEIEARTVRFKNLTAVVVPLGEVALMLANSKSTVVGWSHSVSARMLLVMRYVVLRLTILVASLLAVLVVSELWRRATLAYVRDPNRRRPLMVLRRLAVGLALVLVIAFGLVSEVGSLATFMGFLTAGIAVTLQNVILSVVSYFFLIGRYGVQVGDRITLAGVTGRVIDVSLLRIFLLELSGADLHSTGRVVVLSNAVLFQQQALYKQIPGADYLWHTVTLSITTGASIEQASRTLEAAAAEVYGRYRAAIERQHAIMQQRVDFDTGLPRPQVRVEVAEEGLRCTVRYPVPHEEAAAIDQEMVEVLRGAIEADVSMKLQQAGAVKLSWDT
jgi:small-conductance mechanosensitive channel